MASTDFLCCCIWMTTIFVLPFPGAAQSSCTSPGGVVNAQIGSLPPYSHGDSVTYQCNTGYSMTGSPTAVTCNNGAWTGSAPVCYANCATPSWLAFANVVTTSPYQHGDLITYQCYAGYTMFVGGPSLTCNDGSWTGTSPVCYADCPTPTLDFGSVLTSSPYVHGDTVTFQCDTWYTLVGTATQTCDNGAFNGGGTPTCYWNCSSTDVPGVANAVVISSHPYMHGDLLTFRCYHGYTMTGSPSQRCFNATWTGSLPSCGAVVFSPVTDQTLVIVTRQSQEEEADEALFMTGMWGMLGGFFMVVAAILITGIVIICNRFQCCETVIQPEPEPEPEKEDRVAAPRLVEKVMQARYVPKDIGHENPWRPFGKHAIQEREIRK